MKLFNAWLKPNGTIIEVGYMCHNEYAWEWFKQEFGDDYYEEYEKLSEKYKFSSPYEYLHILGWVRIHTTSSKRTKAIGNCTTSEWTLDTIDPTLSQQQKKFLKDWCLENKYKYEKLFN